MNNFKINDNVHGFVVSKITPVDDICATAVEFIYPQNGCKLLWLDRPDNNKTFAITFKTIPEDSTGVFHILEHSVLCGSDKYPLKEPFVDLLKSSLQTFLNAMTFLDKTMYPVSSRNDKDLKNLIDVYMDAVFNPLIHSKKEIFMQEGWHIEENEKGEWSYNGVVYNEMRGVFSSVDSIMMYELLRKLFPDTCYGYESGGAPKAIPELTYEKFAETHKRFYHPSNATIFLDGDVNLDDILPMLEGYICKYDKKENDFDVVLQAPVMPKTECVAYEVAPDDDALEKTEIAKGYVYGDYSDRIKIFAVNVLCDILCGSNDAPLKKALLEKGLCEDVYFSGVDDTKQKAVFLILRGVPKGREQEAEKVIREVISDLADNGIEKSQLIADINITEFAMKEADFGTTPAGLVYAIKAQETWLYGGEPTESLCYADVFATLREYLDSCYYEELLEKVFLYNSHCATVYMQPDAELSQKNAEKMRAHMQQVKASYSEEEKEILKEENRRLNIFQTTPDTPEQSAAVPHLEVSDIDRSIKPDETEITEICGVKTISAIAPLEGIEYANLYFSLDGLSEKELWAASVLATVLPQCATTKHSALDFNTIAKTYLGSLAFSLAVIEQYHDKTDCTPYLKINVGGLTANEDKMVEILAERLNETVISSARVAEILKQEKLDYEISLKESGHTHAARAVRATMSRGGVIADITKGQTNYVFNVEALANVEELSQIIGSLAKRIFTKQRLTIGIIGKKNLDFARSLIEQIADSDENIEKVDYPFREENKKIRIASDVSYAAKGIDLVPTGYKPTGAMAVASRILRLEYLWTEVRVKGGAYGCFCQSGPNGMLVFASYRDPNPANSLAIYDKAGDALRKIASSEGDLSKYIVGTISDTDPVRTPYGVGKHAIERLLAGRVHEDTENYRRQILDTTAEQLIQLADEFDKLKKGGKVCTVGP